MPTDHQNRRLKASAQKCARALRRAQAALDDYLIACRACGIPVREYNDSRLKLRDDCAEYAGWLERHDGR